MSDLDRRTIDALRRQDPETWRDVPDERIKRTLAFTAARMGLATRDLGASVMRDLERITTRWRGTLPTRRGHSREPNAPRTPPGSRPHHKPERENAGR